ncbi:hypothetical protein LCGC14_0520260 [marine sediment metagenome]|uniref:Uncharacterized protein n=1 Tax=marine sediment metagenome TaxID=412755 RepID=A0A0F9V6T0_9ZZZZ
MDKQITIIAAQPIQYMAPLWQVDLLGPKLNVESLEWLNEQPISIVASNVQGWPPFSHLVEVEVEIEGTWQYLALAQGA